MASALPSLQTPPGQPFISKELSRYSILHLSTRCPCTLSPILVTWIPYPPVHIPNPPLIKLILSKDFFSLNEIMLDFFSISGTWAEFQIDPRNYFFFCLIVFISEALKIVVSIRLLVKVPHEYNFTLSWHFIREISIFVFLSPLSNLKWGVFFCCRSNIIFCLCCHCPLNLINPHLVRPDKAD